MTLQKSERKMMKRILLTLFAVTSVALTAQVTCHPLLEGAKERLYEDINYLASDDLQGRQPGTEGIELAAQYIAQQFESIGLQPILEDGYYQTFTIPDWVSFGDNNSLVYKGDEYTLAEDYFPASWNENGSASGKTIDVGFGISAPELNYDDYANIKPKKLSGGIFIIDISSPDGIHPHSKYLKYHDLGERIELARQKGAAGVILVNRKGMASDLEVKYRKIHGRRLPVVFIADSTLAQSIKSNKKVSMTTSASEERIIANNLLGMINNDASSTVILGAHYDHLGLGAEGSLYDGNEPAVHNGADDNASGVAGILELARNLAADTSSGERPNYLILAFSGEEMGLLGSSFFAENMGELEIESRYMINLDMVGRLEQQQLAVNGVGTSPVWKDFIREKGCNELKIKTSQSGVGPSDHTSFYYQEIPVLHFFTGTHEDYHKPSDDTEKINFEGELQVLGYILGLLYDTRSLENLAFTPTKDESTKAPKFSVTLGVMPDYMYEGEGMRIDGVTDGKPAARAGLKKGDVIVQMGEVKVVDMMSYMKGLGQFKKGDEAEVTFRRAGEEQSVMVKF